MKHIPGRAARMAAALAAAALVCAADAGADSAFNASEAVVGRAVKNYRLINQDGQFTQFHSFKGKPVLLSFFYTECPGPCVMLNQSLMTLREKFEPSLAARVALVSVTVDMLRDTPAKLRDYGLAFTTAFDQWTFARADGGTLEGMAADLGFKFKKAGDGFEHMNRVTLIGPDGVVRRHFYGTEFDAAEVQEALRASIEGRTVKSVLSDALARAMIYCSNYDPVTRTYQIDYKFIGSIIVQYTLVMGSLLFIWRGSIARWLAKLFYREEHRPNGTDPTPRGSAI